MNRAQSDLFAGGAVLWSKLTTGAGWRLILVGLVYVAATSEGSCLMMKRLLQSERGKRRVGAHG